jgi:hypothetical protein
MEYKEFLETKRKTFLESGFDVNESDLNPLLKDFQKFGIKTALFKGRFAFFFDCGLGKTFSQLEWSKQVSIFTNAPVLILAPLAIVEQTISEGSKFGIDIFKYDFENTPCFNEPSIFICNYDQLKNIDCSIFSGIVLDESSILKGKDGKLSTLIIESFKQTPYKLCCTATPSPNDHMELGQHSEFLGAMSYLEMLAMFFVHDGGETSKWRLRKHAQDPFWKYVSSWSMAIDNPKSLGFDSEGYDLPEIEYIEHIISVENKTENLFGDVAVSATELHKDLNRSFDLRLKKLFLWPVLAAGVFRASLIACCLISWADLWAAGWLTVWFVSERLFSTFFARGCLIGPISIRLGCPVIGVFGLSAGLTV